jgi:cytoskeletal protein CcmA (bactofilin family)
MKVIMFLAAALATLSPASAVQQTELGGKVRSGREVVIPATETVRGDLIASGGTVRIEGRVDGDLVASGGQVTVAGTITGDLLAAAGSTTISGTVDGDARVATGQATIQRQARVGEDLLVGAGQATIDRGARIGGDLIFGAGRMTMDGTVAGSVLGSTGNYTTGGSVAGTEQVNVGQPQERAEPTLADRLLDGLRRYVSLLVVGGLLLWLLPRLIRGAAETVRGRPLLSLGVGVLGFLGAVVALVLLVLVTVLVAVVLGLLGLGSLTGVTVFGGILVAAVVVFLLVLALVFAAPATVGLALGRLLVRGDGRSLLGWLGALALGVLVVVLVAAIPVVGGWLEALLVLLGLGALLLTARPGRRLGEPSGLSPADAAPGR